MRAASLFLAAIALLACSSARQEKEDRCAKVKSDLSQCIGNAALPAPNIKLK